MRTLTRGGAAGGAASRYKKCVVRDCPLQETNEGVKESITMD